MENKKLDKKAIKTRVLEHIKSGKNYSQTKEMLEKEGINYPALKNSFYVWKQQIFPTEKIDEGLALAGQKREKREKKQAKKLIDWNPQKQKKADESKLAELINQGIFAAVPCPKKGLKFEDVQKINVGGSVIATVQYYFPDFNLDHPLVVLTTRVILLVIKVKQLCYMIQKKVEEINDNLNDKLSGIKPEWIKK